MKTVAVTVAILALGLAACQKSEEVNNAAETNVENAADADTNAATNDAVANADSALNNAVEDTGNAVENAGNAVENAAENATN